MSEANQPEETASVTSVRVEGDVSLLDLPDSPGHWEKVADGGETSQWEVYFRDWRGAQHPFATNENQTDPCAWLIGRWRKISDDYHGWLEDNYY